jgi:hypothetical protein
MPVARSGDLHKRWHAIRIIPRIRVGRCTFHQQAFVAKEDLIAHPAVSSLVPQTGRGPTTIAADLLRQTKRVGQV